VCYGKSPSIQSWRLHPSDLLQFWSPTEGSTSKHHGWVRFPTSQQLTAGTNLIGISKGTNHLHTAGLTILFRATELPCNQARN
jgi:hypothetical protein